MPHYSPPLLGSWIYPGLRWKFPPGERKIYLSFDDGPSEETENILGILNKWDAKASFFFLGRQLESSPLKIEILLREGHVLGNHSYSHLSGLFAGTYKYLADIHQAAQLIPSQLFRPPYGRIMPWQLKQVQAHYEIIMWDVMSMDYHPSFSSGLILHHLLQSTRDGSIVVFHENKEALKKLPHILPHFLEHFSRQGFSFSAIAHA